ncbi:MAG TPA: glycoside hydrolase family 99-like domain-containing protein [Sphingomonas sp.]|jgi:lipopolysaccharide biosynthesis protein
MVTTVAFYLPQFHPIPENDKWWGPGFTEWTNVARARPRFRGHYQPHVPGELGYYDLRLAETREQQAALAKEHRVDAFAYYHYWFNGRQLLERPLDEVLRTKSPDHKFLVAWANENWTRTWDGQERSVLMQQSYEDYDPDAHVAWLAPAFADPRYVRVAGKPVWLIYTASDLPDPGATVAAWRSAAKRRGIDDLYICAILARRPLSTDQALSAGFDAVVEFAPQFYPHQRNWRNRLTLPARAWNKLVASKIGRGNIDHFNIYDYDKVVADGVRKKSDDHIRVHPCVAPGWDNSPRRPTTGLVCQNDDPALYGRWLESAVRRAQANPPGEQLVFINAWNEWGEGCHLEPDLRHGRAWLEATRDAVERAERT